jgi:hypothetical protein
MSVRMVWPAAVVAAALVAAAPAVAQSPQTQDKTVTATGTTAGCRFGRRETQSSSPDSPEPARPDGSAFVKGAVSGTST